MEFLDFGKMARLSRECVITEKIDGTNAQIAIDEEGKMFVGSRKRWITPDDDNFGFAKWAREHEEELLTLGPGRHYGEWWGQGIQRKYGMEEKVFSLFNVSRWNEDNVPPCCRVVPVLYKGEFTTEAVCVALDVLEESGSRASPGFMDPEGVVVYHTASCSYFKKTIKNDEVPKGRLQNDNKSLR